MPLPSAPGEFQCSATVTTISCTWSQRETDVVLNYLISWVYTGPCDTDSQSFLLGGQDRSHTLRDLEKNGMYTVNLYAINSAGRIPALSVQVVANAGMSIVLLYVSIALKINS